MMEGETGHGSAKQFRSPTSAGRVCFAELGEPGSDHSGSNPPTPLNWLHCLGMNTEKSYHNKEVIYFQRRLASELPAGPRAQSNSPGEVRNSS